MGNQSTNKQPYSSIVFREEDWVQESQPPNKQLGDYTTLRNIHTDQLIDQYQVIFSSEEDYQNYLESFRWRKRDPHIVRTYHYSPKQHRQFCSTVYSLIVYIYHPRGRLSDYRDIPYPDNLYCMMAMLDGYKKIFDKIGKFYLAEEQVCIDEDGEVRVWVNSDLSKNYPEIYEEQREIVGADEEAEMVEQILYMVINNTDTSTEPTSLRFSDFLEKQKKHKRLIFQEGKSIVHEYAKCHNDNIPNVFEAFLKHVNQDSDDVSKEEEDDLQFANLQKSKSIDGPPFKPQSTVLQSNQIPPQQHQKPLYSSNSFMNPIHSRENFPFQSQQPIFPQRSFSPIQPIQQPVQRSVFYQKPPAPIHHQREPIFVRENIRQENPFFSPQYQPGHFVIPQRPVFAGPPHQHVVYQAYPPYHNRQIPHHQIPHHQIPVMPPNQTKQKLRESIEKPVQFIPIKTMSPKRISSKIEQRKEQKMEYLNENSSEVDEDNIMRQLSELRSLQKREEEEERHDWRKNYEKAELYEGFEAKKSNFYHTLGEQKQIDPEIAADLLLYT